MQSVSYERKFSPELPVKTAVFWIMSYSLVDKYECFEGIYIFHLQLRNILYPHTKILTLRRRRRRRRRTRTRRRRRRKIRRDN
jgi:hypothetical protein